MTRFLSEEGEQQLPAGGCRWSCGFGALRSRTGRGGQWRRAELCEAEGDVAL
jgi:hypothetical protein